MIQIRNLASIDLSRITACFNDAFSDYIIQFKATEEYLEDRWSAAGVDYSLSFGAFFEDELVGFIINAIDNWNGVKTAFNVGTGVIPAQRGKRLVKKLYEHALPVLRGEFIKQGLLEVIQENEKAIKAYESVGFGIKRELHSYIYSGENTQSKKIQSNDLEIYMEKNLSKLSWNIINSFADFDSSWENSNSCINRSLGKYNFWGITKKEKILGYAIVNPKTGYIPQFAISQTERRKGYGRFLFQNLQEQFERLIIVNVDGNSSAANLFLRNMQFKPYISQFEMGRLF